LIRSAVQEVLDEREQKRPLRSPSVQAPPNPRAILDLPPLRRLAEIKYPKYAKLEGWRIYHGKTNTS
jgi:hypothetical protein